MTDLNQKYKYFSQHNHTGYAANPMQKVDLNDSRIREHLSENTVGKVVENISEEDNKSSGTAKTLICGAIPVFALTWINNKLMDGENFSKTLFSKFINKVDNFSNKRLGFFKRFGEFSKKVGNKITQSQLGKDIAKVSGSVQPIWGQAKESVLCTKQSLINELISRGKSIVPETSEEALKVMERQIKERGITHNEAYKKVLELVGDNADSAFNSINNRIVSISNTKGNTFLGKAFKQAFAATNKIFNTGKVEGGIAGALGPLVNIYFVGSAVKKAIEAPKEDKVSTFTESVATELIPYWVLYNAYANKTFQAASLKNLPKAKGFIGEMLRKPVRFLGRALSIGSAGQLTQHMSLKDAEKLYGKEGAQKFLKEVVEVAISGKPAELWKKSLKKLNKTVPLWKKIPARAKNWGGGLARLAFMLVVIEPFMSKLLKFGSYTLFGKPKATFEEEQKAKMEKIAGKMNSNIDVILENGDGSISEADKASLTGAKEELTKAIESGAKPEQLQPLLEKTQITILSSLFPDHPMIKKLKEQMAESSKEQAKGNTKYIKSPSAKNPMIEKFLKLRTPEVNQHEDSKKNKDLEIKGKKAPLVEKFLKSRTGEQDNSLGSQKVSDTKHEETEEKPANVLGLFENKDNKSKGIETDYIPSSNPAKLNKDEDRQEFLKKMVKIDEIIKQADKTLKGM